MWYTQTLVFFLFCRLKCFPPFIPDLYLDYDFYKSFWDVIRKQSTFERPVQLANLKWETSVWKIYYPTEKCFSCCLSTMYWFYKKYFTVLPPFWASWFFQRHSNIILSRFTSTGEIWRRIPILSLFSNAFNVQCWIPFPFYRIGLRNDILVALRLFTILSNSLPIPYIHAALGLIESMFSIWNTRTPVI